ncbi:MAG: hypothetical protein WC253_04630 [Sulfurovaceae bacterium]
MTYEKPIFELPKISLFDKRIFRTFETRKLYNFVIIKNLKLDEPFHSTFVKFLVAIEDSELWIKSPATKVIKINIRDSQNSFVQSSTFKVIYLLDIIKEAIFELYETIDKSSNRMDYRESTILGIIILLISKTDDIKYFYEKNGVSEQEALEDLAKKLIPVAFVGLTISITKRDNFSYIKQSCNRMLDNMEEYSFVKAEDYIPKTFTLENIKLPQKILVSRNEI